MATPLWVRKMLQQRGIPFTEVHHAPAYSAQQVARSEHISGRRVAKVVVVVADERPVELILPATRDVDFRRIREVLGCRVVRLANEAEMQSWFADCEVGAVPPLRHWEGVPVLMDRELTVEGEILFQAGTHEDAVRLNFRDWYEMVNPQVATFSEPTDLVLAWT
jgi:Ala-tRNA(Pro) deacylase